MTGGRDAAGRLGRVDFDTRLLLERYRRVGAMVPLLYLVIGMNALAVMLASHGDFPLVYRLLLPGLLIAASGWRFLVWQRRRGQPPPPALARRHLRQTFALAALLSLAGGLWTAGAYLEVHETRRALPAFFIVIAGVATASCLAAMPRAPQVAIALALAPITLAMLLTPDPGLRASAFAIALLAAVVMHHAAHYASEVEANLRLQDQLERQAWYDSLTGLANRHAFAIAFEAARQEAAAGDWLALVIIDLDGFKQANDTFGHVAGDGVLVETASRLHQLFADARLIARFGGDEFVLLFAGERGADWDERLAAAARVMALPVADGLHTIPISASFGRAEAPADEAHLDRLLIAADEALYSAKARRHSQVRRRA